MLDESFRTTSFVSVKNVDASKRVRRRKKGNISEWSISNKGSHGWRCVGIQVMSVPTYAYFQTKKIKKEKERKEKKKKIQYVPITSFTTAYENGITVNFSFVLSHK